jgi:hypothetical protein
MRHLDAVVKSQIYQFHKYHLREVPEVGEQFGGKRKEGQTITVVMQRRI